METEANVHEHYLRHLLLLGQAVPVLLRATVIKAVDYCNKNLETILLEAEFTFKILFVQQYNKLFPQGGVNTDLMSWDTRLLCIVICFLFYLRLSETDRVAITCIMEQLNDLENYVDSASLDYKTYETKWKTLHKALLDSLKNSDSKTKYDCTRLIQSFAKEPIHVDMALIHRLKEIKDVNEQVNMAIKDFNNANDADEEIKSGIEDLWTYKTDTKVQISQSSQHLNVKESETLVLEGELTKPDIPVKWLKEQPELMPDYRTKIFCLEVPTSFSSKLQDEKVYENEEVVLSCVTNTEGKNINWFKYSDPLKETKNITFSQDGCRHSLKVTAACLQDTGIYSCVAATGKTITSAYVNVQELPTLFSSKLQDNNVYENEEVVLSCETYTDGKNTNWFKYSDPLKETKNITLSKDGCRHCLKVTAACLQDTGIYSCVAATGETITSAYVNVQELPTTFSTQLQDTNVYENEKVVLVCETNTDGKRLSWFKSSDRLIETSNISFSDEGCRHYLELSEAGLQDTGIYSCLSSSGDAITSAYVNVQGLPVEFIENLTDKEIPEGKDITFTCKVTRLRIPVWFHDGTELKTSNLRRNLFSNGKEHKLTILNAKFYDEGTYMAAFGDISSKANLTVTDNSNDLYRQQLPDTNYRNWVQGALSLLYLKQGLLAFSDKCILKQHGIFIGKLPSSANQCTHCSLDTLMPFSCHSSNRYSHKRNCLCSKKPKPPNKRTVCPNDGFCSRIYDLIRDYHRNGDPCLANADIPAWNSDPWSVGVCFVNTPGYKHKTSAQEIDCSGLLSVFINNKFFNTELGDVKIDGKSDLFKQARDARNEVLHNPNYELSISELNRFINLFRAVLEVRNAANKKPLETELGQSEAMENLKRLQNHQIDIDEEVGKTTKAIIDQEIMESLEKAREETEKKNKKLEETLKEKDEQMKCLRQVRNCQPPKKMARFEVTFDMTIAITGSSKVKQHHEKIRERIGTVISSPKGTQSSEESSPSKSSVDIAVETLMSSVVKLPDVDVSLADYSAGLILNIAVSSCDGMNALLTLINGKSFQQSVNQLRKSIEKDIGESVFVDAFITSDSCNAVRNQLNAQGILYDTHGDFRCNSHSWMQNAWYCVEHEEFCCTICKSNEHGSCKGMKNVTSKRTEKKLLKVQKKKNYNVRVGGTFKCDKEICNVSGICVLSTGEMLLADNGNKRLKKLNSSFKSVSCCDLPFHPQDVCHIGKDVAAVTHRESSIQLVDVSGKMKLMHRINVNFRCNRLVCHGDILYITSGDKVYTCNTDGTCHQALFSLDRSYDLVNSIAVSDDGEKIYIADIEGRILAVDKEGKIISANKFEGVRYVRTVGDGTLLIFSEVTKCVFQQYDEGERVLGSVVDDVDALDCVKSLCFDRQHCRLIVAKSESDKISVFELK